MEPLQRPHSILVMKSVFPFAVGLLEGAGTASLLVVGSEDAVTPIHDRGHLVTVFIEVADALLLDDLEGRRGEQMAHMG